MNLGFLYKVVTSTKNIFLFKKVTLTPRRKTAYVIKLKYTSYYKNQIVKCQPIQKKEINSNDNEMTSKTCSVALQLKYVNTNWERFQFSEN